MLAQDALPFVLLCPLLALGVPIGFGLILSGMATLLLSGDHTLLSAVRFLLDAPRQYTLIAVPLCILTAEFFVSGGLIELLFQGARAWVGHLPGGVGSATVGGTMIFAGISGSSAADAAAFSRIGVEGMAGQGFRREFAACTVASSSTLAIMIPPSIAMVIYGSLTDTSIGALWFAGIVPGLTFGLVHLAYVAWVARREGIGRDTQAASWPERWKYLLQLSPILGVMGLILGGLYTGNFTPTEISAMSSLSAFVAARFWYRTLAWRDIPRVFTRTATMSAAIFLIIIGANVFAKALTATGFAGRLVMVIHAANLSPTEFLLCVSVALFFLGMFLEGISLNVMTTPLLFPIVRELGIDPVQYGVFLIFNIEVALITPPVGLHLFIASAASGVPIHRIYANIWPFMAILAIGTLTLIFFPAYALWLPRLMHGR